MLNSAFLHKKKKALRSFCARLGFLGRESGTGLGVVADAVKGLTGVCDREGQTGAVGKPAVVGGGTHGGRSVRVGTDASVAAVGTDLDHAAGDGLT